MNMNYLIDILKGMVIGISNIIPGVSGGTMAVSLGIYDRMIFSISQLFKDWKASLKTLMPILIGAGFGIVAFTYTIEFLLSNYTLPTALAFVGMILGGIPVLWVSFKAGLKMKNEKLNAGHFIIFILMFALVAVLPMFQGVESSFEAIAITPISMIKLFGIGIIASATMVVPGMSGSLVLIVLGYYYSIVNTITSFIDALRARDMEAVLPNFIVLFVFGVAVLIGIFLISKVI
jgi:putative membrane protein